MGAVVKAAPFAACPTVETTDTPHPDGIVEVDPTITCGIESGTAVAPGAGYTSTVWDTPEGDPQLLGVELLFELLQAPTARATPASANPAKILLIRRIISDKP